MTVGGSMTEEGACPVQNGAVTQPDPTDWVTSKGYFPGLTG